MNNGQSYKTKKKVNRSIIDQIEYNNFICELNNLVLLLNQEVKDMPHWLQKIVRSE